MFIEDDLYKVILKSLPIACVDALILYEGRCLLLLRDKEPAKGKYWFPGGRINKMETIVTAVLRKAKEETNLDCTFERIVSVEESLFAKENEMAVGIHTINTCCLLSVKSIQALRLDSLHKDFKWVQNQNENYHEAVNHPLSLLGYQY